MIMLHGNHHPVQHFMRPPELRMALGVFWRLRADSGQARILWARTDGCCVPGQVISRGMRHRRMGSHELNMESSRSHSIMTVYCDAAARASADDMAADYSSLASSGKISFVDLVGCSAFALGTTVFCRP